MTPLAGPMRLGPGWATQGEGGEGQLLGRGKKNKLPERGKVGAGRPGRWAAGLRRKEKELGQAERE